MKDGWDIQGWTVIDGHHLEASFAFPDFRSALAFVNRVGAEAERANHHPDIVLRWGEVRITTWSHDVDGLTERDRSLALAINSLCVEA